MARHNYGAIWDRHIAESCTLQRKRAIGHIQADIVQEVVNVEFFTLLQNRGVLLQIHRVHDTLVIQLKELHKGICKEQISDSIFRAKYLKIIELQISSNQG